MKIIKLFWGALLASSLVVLPSCEGLDITGGKETAELQPDEQKAKLEAVALALMETSPADNMQDLVDLYSAFEETYLEDDSYDFDALLSFGEDAVDASYSEEYSRIYDELKKTYTRASVVNLAVTLSNHNGEFTFGKDAVSKVQNSSFDGVKVNFTLEGKQYTAELKPSGEVTTATYNYSEIDKWNSYGYWDENDNYVDAGEVQIIYDDMFNCTIDVPAKIVVGLYEEGSYVAELTIEMNKNFSAAGLNPAVDNFNSKATFVLNNGYEIIVDKFAFDGAKKKAGSAAVFKKDGKTLVSAEGTADVSLENDVYKRESTNGEYSEYDIVKVKVAKNIDVVVDILGQVQIKGVCSNALEAIESMDAYYDALDLWDDEGRQKAADETAALRHLNNLNAKLDLGVYYDGGSNRQAYLEFEMDKEQAEWDMNGDGLVNNLDVHYDIIPVIVFTDNSRYTVEDYFTEEAFDTLLNRAEGFADDYDALLGTFFEEEKLEVLPY